MSRLRRIVHVLIAVLRELADEAAYRRHLSRSGGEDSAQAWRRFTDRRYARRYGGPRCC